MANALRLMAAFVALLAGCALQALGRGLSAWSAGCLRRGGWWIGWALEQRRR